MQNAMQAATLKDLAAPRVYLRVDDNLTKVRIPGCTDYFGETFYVSLLNSLIKTKGYREALADAIAYYEGVKRDLYDIDGRQETRLRDAIVYLKALHLRCLAASYVPETIAG